MNRLVFLLLNLGLFLSCYEAVAASSQNGSANLNQLLKLQILRQQMEYAPRSRLGVDATKEQQQTKETQDDKQEAPENQDPLRPTEANRKAPSETGGQGPKFEDPHGVVITVGPKAKEKDTHTPEPPPTPSYLTASQCRSNVREAIKNNDPVLWNKTTGPCRINPNLSGEDGLKRVRSRLR